MVTLRRQRFMYGLDCSASQQGLK